MSDSESSDVTWEEFFGPTTDLMPTLLGMYDETSQKYIKSSPVKKSVNNFTNLSPNVQKMLNNISDQNEEETIQFNENNNIHNTVCAENHNCTKNLKNNNKSVQKVSRYLEGQKSIYSSARIHRQSKFYDNNKYSVQSGLNKSSEFLNTICDNVTSNVQKMLSNIPDQDLIISNSVIDNQNCDNFNISNTKIISNNNSFLYKSFSNKGSGESVRRTISFNVSTKTSDEFNRTNKNQSVSPNLSTNHKFKSSTMPGNYVQIPTSNSETSSEKEVSRPVSLTSLGSCSSSSSSGPPTQPSSMYLASTESLDSDPEPNGSQGSGDSGIAETAVSNPEQRVLQEVLDTEHVYVTDLKQVVQGYLQVWRSTPNSPLTPYLRNLFSNFEDIYEFNRKFLDELYEAGNDPTFIANAFVQNDAGFRIYTEYCTDYPQIMATLTDLTKNEMTAKLIRERQLALGHALPLGSYLLKPVQRILKYHLLLQRLLKLCNAIHFPSIEKALQTMTSIASDINHMKGKHEHEVRVQEIQSQLYGWTGDDLSAMGELCAEGTFRVGGARGYRQVFLFDKVLLITKSKSDGGLAYKSHIMCSNLMLVESVRGEPLSFHVIPFDNPRFQVTLRAKSLEHKREWTLQLKRVILENYNAVIPSHARQLVMQLGQDVNISNDNAAVDKWSLLKQHSTPQYLERRTRIRKTRDPSERRAASIDRSFASLASWRRKSEPNVAHYNTKTLPKKISKLKKAKERSSSTKFYTDISDSETCDVISESTDSLAEIKTPEIQENDTKLASNTLEQVVEQLLMQNQEFYKILHRQKKIIKDENHGVWLKQNVINMEKPKSDSLPRSFQLNEEPKIEKEIRVESETSLTQDEIDTSLDTTSETIEDDDLLPDHKIYRKSAIRFSLVQRFRAIISEEEKSRTNQKLPTYKQGSELMGAKIAQPDYADPQKLFGNFTNSQMSLNSSYSDNSQTEKISNKNSPTEKSNNIFETIIDTGQKYLKIKSPLSEKKKLFCDKSKNNSSQNNFVKNKNIFESQNESDYYESILEKSLNNDEKSFEKVQNNKNINSAITQSKIETQKSTESIRPLQKPVINPKPIKRPLKPPPPIPQKPTFSRLPQSTPPPNTKGWVKTVASRFE